MKIVSGSPEKPPQNMPSIPIVPRSKNTHLNTFERKTLGMSVLPRFVPSHRSTIIGVALKCQTCPVLPGSVRVFSFVRTAFVCGDGNPMSRRIGTEYAALPLPSDCCFAENHESKKATASNENGRVTRGSCTEVRSYRATGS